MVDLLPGRATTEGTLRYTKRHNVIGTLDGFRAAFAPQSGRGLQLSSVGIGTYLGEADVARDEGYREAIEAAVGGGINVVDTAINYRHQRSERVVGEALRAVGVANGVGRDEVFIATKGGFIPFDADAEDPEAAVRREYVETGLISEANVVAGMHCIDPAYLKDQIDRSRRNIGVATLDLYFVHNPETQLREVDEDVLYDRLRAAFVALEQAVADGRIARYGLATWDGLRTPRGSGAHLDLARALAVASEAAMEVGHERHHLEAIQAPLNLQMTEAVLQPSQRTMTGRGVALAEFAAESGIAFFTSASLLQGRLRQGVPAAVRERVGDVGNDAQVALQAVRSARGVTTALVGMSDPAHVAEATELLGSAKPDAADVWAAEARAR